ncbi:hypothetical protein OROMI_009669 [Orobanche minor]
MENLLPRRNYCFLRHRLCSSLFPSATKPYTISLQRIDKGLFKQQKPD